MNDFSPECLERQRINSQFKAPSFESQLIDANCSDCIFMIRNLEKFKIQEEWNRNLQEQDFNRQKAKEIEDAQWVIDNATDDLMRKSGEGMLWKANKMKFQFSRVGLISYGHCSKLDKHVSFIPNTCQIETQECFEHRRLKSNKL